MVYLELLITTLHIILSHDSSRIHCHLHIEVHASDYRLLINKFLHLLIRKSKVFHISLVLEVRKHWIIEAFPLFRIIISIIL